MELYPTPDNPAPPGAECRDVLTRDGICLRAMRVVPENPRGTVVILGGRGDFAERYFETMHELLARGFAVASVDFRGQGGSARLSANRYRGHLKSFALFDEDLRSFMDAEALPHLPRPFYAIGHSTGGQVLLRALRNRTWFRKAILVSPLIDVNYGSWPKPAAALLVNSAVALGFGSMFLPGVMKRPFSRDDYPGNPLNNDRRRWNRDSAILEHAPQLGLGGATFSWLHAARASFAQVAKVKKLTAPVLIVAAGNERVVNKEAIYRFARQVPGVALVEIPEALHEVLAESDTIRRQFFAAFDSFVTGDTGA